jgi:type IV pilus assembly protein PilO
MPNLAPARNRFKSVAIALGVICVLALVYLVTPFGPAKTEHYQELETARAELKARQVQLAPLRGLPTKVQVSQKDIQNFYRDRFAARFSVVSTEIGKVAAKNNVQLSGVRYEAFDTDVNPIQQVVMQADLSGNYGDVAKFINALERNEIFFLIDDITLADEKAGKVKLLLTLETYMHPDGVKATAKKTDKESAD